MFEKFQQEVFARYLELRGLHALPDGLDPITRSGLRAHAKHVLAERYDPKDDEVIRRFFDADNRYTNHDERIDHFELDGFRSLVNFLEGRTRNPDERVVKILAWLIDFEPRPYGEWQRAQRPAGTGPLEADSAPRTGLPAKDVDNTMPKPDETKTRRRNKRLPWFLAGATLFTSLAAYFAINRPECLEKQCMYWLSDRYMTICCGQQPPGVTAIAINPYELEHFRKITRPDTLTSQHANKVWYSKIDNQIEFFTAPATHHPVHYDRPIKPATAYIIETYAGKNAD